MGALSRALARRAGLDLERLMDERPRVVHPARAETLSSPANGKPATATPKDDRTPPNTPALLAKVIEHYHRTFCERDDAQGYLKQRGISDADLWRAHRMASA